MVARLQWPLFCLVLALLACHELDAMVKNEWHLLPVLKNMPDTQAMPLFIWLHIPMFAVLFWMGGHENPVWRRRMQALIDSLVIVHAAAHFILSGHPHYEFEPPIETITVYGAAVIAMLHGAALLQLSHTRQ